MQRRLDPGSWAGLTSPTDRPALLRHCRARVRTSARTRRKGRAILHWREPPGRIQPRPNFLEKGPVSPAILLSSSFVAFRKQPGPSSSIVFISNCAGSQKCCCQCVSALVTPENAPDRTIILIYYLVLDSVDLLRIVFRTITDVLLFEHSVLFRSRRVHGSL